MKKVSLTQGQFALVSDEDFESINEFKWSARWCKFTGSFYAMRNSKTDSEGKRHIILMHRYVMDTPKGLVSDHINHDTLDNRRCNLRNITSSQNNMNKKKQKSNTSGIVGVNFHKGNKKWRAFINVNKKQKSLGYYKLKCMAVKARLEAEDKYFGEFKYKQN